MNWGDEFLMKALSEQQLIKIGDRVNIFFENIPALFEAEILYIPCATGDCWKLRTSPSTNTYQIHYVQTFSRMDKI